MIPREEYTKTLIDLGLTLIQAKIVIAIGFRNYESVGNISKISKIARQQIYCTLPELQKLGLIEKKIGAPNQYKSLPISDVITILSDRKKAETEKIIEKASILKIESQNELKNFAGINQDYELKIITGWENLKKTFKKAFETSDELRIVTNLQPWIFQVYSLLEFDTIKPKKNAELRMIIGANPSIKWPPKWPSGNFYKPQIGILDFEIPMSVTICNNKIALLTMNLKEDKLETEDFNLLTCDHPKIVETLSMYFQILWNLAKKQTPTQSLFRENSRERQPISNIN